MAEQLYVNKPGGVIVHYKDGTSHNLTYGDPVDQSLVADYVDVRTFADNQKRKPDADELAVADAHRRAALAENGQVNSSSSPVPSNYSDLDEDAASQLVSNLASYPEAQAAVVKHELAFGGGRQKVIDAAGEYAKTAAGLLQEADPDTTKGNQGASLLEEPSAIPAPDPALLPNGLSEEDDQARAQAVRGRAKSAGDDISALSGEELDKQVAEAGIDASTGGSKSDGGLTADEKRAALRQARGEQPLTPSPS